MMRCLDSDSKGSAILSVDTQFEIQVSRCQASDLVRLGLKGSQAKCRSEKEFIQFASQVRALIVMQDSYVDAENVGQR